MLEDAMRRHIVEASKFANMRQIGCLAFMLLSTLMIVARDIAYRDPSAIARAAVTGMHLLMLTV